MRSTHQDGSFLEAEFEIKKSISSNKNNFVPIEMAQPSLKIGGNRTFKLYIKPYLEFHYKSFASVYNTRPRWISTITVPGNVG